MLISYSPELDATLLHTEPTVDIFSRSAECVSSYDLIDGISAFPVPHPISLYRFLLHPYYGNDAFGTSYGSSVVSSDARYLFAPLLLWAGKLPLICVLLQIVDMGLAWLFAETLYALLDESEVTILPEVELVPLAMDLYVPV